MVYTILPDLLRNIRRPEGMFLTDILFVFSQKTNTYKVSRDVNGEIIEIYKSIMENGEVIKTWLDLMSYVPNSFEVINVDISDIPVEETKFIKLCKETVGQNKIIVYSKQNIINHEFSGPYIIFEDRAITVLDRDEARQELNYPPAGDNNTFVNSQVAQNNSQITKSNN
jgi:hypothetical protein